MVLVVFFGVLMMVFSLTMIISPSFWSKNILLFSYKPWFHPFEIISRLIFGIVFIAYGDQTAHPQVMRSIGLILLLVGVGLLFTPPGKHRHFARWSARKFLKVFRPAGVVSLCFGAFIIYSAVTH